MISVSRGSSTRLRVHFGTVGYFEKGGTFDGTIFFEFQ